MNPGYILHNCCFFIQVHNRNLHTFMGLFPIRTRARNVRFISSEFNHLLVYKSTMLNLTESKTTSCRNMDLFVKYACFSVDHGWRNVCTF